MTVRSTLWKHYARKDGSCSVKIYSYYKGEKEYRKTELHAHPKDWDEKKGRYKAQVPHAPRMNAILAQMESRAKAELLGENSSLIAFVDQYIIDCQEGREPIRKGTWKKFITHRNHLKAYAISRQLDDITFNDVDLAFYADLKHFLHDRGTGRSGISNQIKALKKFMQLGIDRELHTNVKFKSRVFKAERVQPKDKVYLTPEEVDQVAALNLANRPGLARERDRFLLSYYLILRFGDSLRINRSNFTTHKGRHFYRNIAEKTNAVSFVPVKPAALEILQRYDYNLGTISNQKANQKLKIIAAMADMNYNVSSAGDTPVVKSSLVTTHTARRSAATNLYLAGVPLSEIMQLGGWKFESTLKKYLLAGGIEFAELSAGRAFFR